MTPLSAFLSGVGLCSGLALLAGVVLVAVLVRAGKYDASGGFQP